MKDKPQAGVAVVSSDLAGSDATMTPTTRKSITGIYSVEQLRGLCAWSMQPVDSSEYAALAALRADGIARIMAGADADAVTIVGGEIVSDRCSKSKEV